MKKITAIFLLSILLVFSGCNQETDNTVNTQSSSESNDPSASVNTETTTEWPEITENGVNEELLMQNIDTETLETIAAELQALCDEVIEEEQQNPEIMFTEGFTRVFEKERYKKVIGMGDIAMKPLYLIIYKSENSGMYEYICARALYDLSGFDFDWINSEEFLEKFNKEILEIRKQSST